MKKKISAMLVLLLLATLVFSNTLSYAASNKKGDTFTIDKMKMKITKAASSSEPGEVSIITFSNKKSTSELEIPNTVEFNSKKYKVTNIYYCAFINAKFKSVSLPSSIKKIENGSFKNCTNLTSITIPKNVTLETQVFRNCTNLQSVTLSEGITSVPFSGFIGCEKLKEINIPSTVTKIEGYAFSKCTNLKEIIIPNSVTQIDSYAFSYCKNLTTINIPGSVQSVGINAFKGCKNLTVVIPKYSLYEHSFIDNDIKYQYSDESILSVEPVEAYDPTGGIMYYKITNTTEKALYNIAMEYILLDSIGDQIEGNRLGTINVLKSNESRIVAVMPSKSFSQLNIVFSNNNIRKPKMLDNYLSAVLEEKESIGRHKIYSIKVTSTSPNKINQVEAQLIFYKDNKIVAVSGGSTYNVYKGMSEIDVYLSDSIIYDNYTINVSGYNYN